MDRADASRPPTAGVRSTITCRRWKFDVFVSPSEIKGQWVAHVPVLDLVTQGNSSEHAVFMANEAVEIIITDDIDAGRNPFDRAL